jgi:hypothetical protein
VTVPLGILLGVALAAGAAPAAAQRDVGDPLEHFLATKNASGQRRTLDDPVLRIGEDFNNDGLVDVALWQPRDLGDGAGPVFLYMQRKDGRFAASGSVVADEKTLFRVAPAGSGMARLLVCGRRRYEVSGFIVTELPADGAATECPDGAPEGVERLDAARFKTSGVQAWIRR